MCIRDRVGKYGLIPVDFGVPFAGADNWDGCIVKAEQDCADPQASAWTVSEVHTIITDSLKNKGGIAVDYLEARTYPGPIMMQCWYTWVKSKLVAKMLLLNS